MGVPVAPHCPQGFSGGEWQGLGCGREVVGGRRPHLRVAFGQGLAGKMASEGREGQTFPHRRLCAKAWGGGKSRSHLALGTGTA